ncbi:AI-2E family transporter, partial [Aeromonas sanarellii]
IIFVSTQISFIFKPIGTFVSTLFFPVLISGFLYFLFIPIVRLLEKIKIPKALAIIILYAIFVGLVTLLGALVGPALSKQVTDLADNMPQ